MTNIKGHTSPYLRDDPNFNGCERDGLRVARDDFLNCFNRLMSSSALLVNPMGHLKCLTSEVGVCNFASKEFKSRVRSKLKSVVASFG